MHQTLNIFACIVIVRLVVVGTWICNGQLKKIQKVSIIIYKTILLNKILLILNFLIIKFNRSKEAYTVFRY